MFSYNTGSESELSSDLEWMLRSGQASPEMLAEALLQEYYRPVYQLALAWQLDASAARSLTQEIFIRALVGVYRFHAETDLDHWLFRQVIAACRQSPAPNPPVALTDRRGGSSAFLSAVQRTQPEDRLALLARYGLGWSVADLSNRLGRPSGELGARLNDLTLELDPLLSVDDQFSGLDAAVLQIWPAPEVSTADWLSLVQAVQNQAARQHNAHRRISAYKELILTVIAVFLIGGFFWFASWIFPADETPTPAADEPSSTASPLAVDRSESIRPTRETGRAAGLAAPSVSDSFRQRRIGPRFWVLRPGMVYFVQPGDTIESLAARLGMSPETLRTHNRLSFSDRIEPGQVLNIPERPSFGEGSAARLDRPLSQDSTSQEVYRRILQGAAAWQTLWMEALVELDGPQGYAGQPRVYFVQIWRDRPNARLLVFSGRPGRTVSEIFLVRNGHAYLASPDANKGYVFGKLNEGEPVQSAYLANLVLYPVGNLDGPDTVLEPVDEAWILGRESLVVEHQSPAGEPQARYWLDSLTALPLRQDVFNAVDSSRKLLDVKVTQLFYDQSFPEELFDAERVWPGWFADDYLGAMNDEPAGNLLNAGAELNETKQSGNLQADPASLYLSFEFARLYKTRTAFTPPFADHSAAVFAGDQYLGQLPFGDPWTLICDRSPDGRRFAFVDVLSTSEGRKAPLMWFDLADPGELQYPFNYLFVTEFTFAPDSRRLAVFGYIPPASGSIYMLDTDTGRYARFLSLRSAHSLLWSQDGRFLAFLGRTDGGQGDEMLMVMAADTGEIVFSEVWDPSAPAGAVARSDFPFDHWQDHVPVRMAGLPGCALSPDGW